MSILNLAMYGVALVMKHMGEEMEDMIKRAGGSMAKLREAA